jgi:hypothetical protein
MRGRRWRQMRCLSGLAASRGLTGNREENRENLRRASHAGGPWFDPRRAHSGSPLIKPFSVSAAASVHSSSKTATREFEPRRLRAPFAVVQIARAPWEQCPPVRMSKSFRRRRGIHCRRTPLASPPYGAAVRVLRQRHCRRVPDWLATSTTVAPSARRRETKTGGSVQAACSRRCEALRTARQKLGQPRRYCSRVAGLLTNPPRPTRPARFARRPSG